MAKAEDDALAAALRANLRRRKVQSRDTPPEPSFGADEEGDVVPPDDLTRPGAWSGETPQT